MGMESFDTFSLLVGLIAVGIGLYELATQRLIGRDVSEIPQEKIRKFLPYDVLTYVIAGGLLALMGAGRWFPFAKTGLFVAISIIGSLIVIVLNVIIANKILGRPKSRPPHL